jgi:tetratricopeptide (TPR) repeat protein
MVGFAKSMRVSKMLYNKGLTKANQGELSSAIDSLKQSVQFNKKNYMARNLLGLLYYETGQIADALKHWIISDHLVKSGNQASLYIQKVQNNPTMMHTYNDAVVSYNQALKYLDRQNIDMAIMELNKAVDLNPSFLNALNLLTVCLLMQNNREKTTKVVMRTLEVDRSNALAIHYHIAITGKPPKNIVTKPQKPSNSNKNKQKAPSMYQTVAEKPPTYSFISLSHILSFGLGGVIIAGLLMFFVFPNMVGDRDTQIDNLSVALNDSNVLNEELQTNQNETIQALEAENRDLSWQLESLGDQVAAINQAQNIANARSLVAAGQAEEAADLLYNVNIILVPQDEIGSVQDLMNSTFHQVAYSLYNTGLSNYNQGNFEIAMGFFERSLRFAERSEQSTFFVDDATYFLGRIAQEQGNYEWAIRWFTYVIEDHPNSNMFNSAVARLAEVQAAHMQPPNAEIDDD